MPAITEAKKGKEQMSPEITCLASPYSDPDGFVRAYRVAQAAKAAAKLTTEGHIAYSPVVHGHALCEVSNLDPLSPIWYAHAEAMLRMCDRVTVLRLEGWQTSVGVQHEIKLAKQLGLPVDYLDPI